MQQKVPLMEQILYIQLLKANPKSNLTNLKYYVNARRSAKIIEIKKSQQNNYELEFSKTSKRWDCDMSKYWKELQTHLCLGFYSNKLKIVYKKPYRVSSRFVVQISSANPYISHLKHPRYMAKSRQIKYWWVTLGWFAGLHVCRPPLAYPLFRYNQKLASPFPLTLFFKAILNHLD